MADTDLRSPLFHAMSFRRRQRQELIRQIEEQTGRRLLVYFANDDELWRRLWSLHIAYQMEAVEQSVANIYETRAISLQH
jgi:hypothetical protein